MEAEVHEVISRNQIGRYLTKGWNALGISLVFAVASGCAGTTTVVEFESTLEGKALEWMRAAEKLEDQGNHLDALRKLAAAIELQPSSVRLHRAYQNLALGHLERGALIERYEAALDEAPESPAAWYLCGRLRSNLEVQRQYFDQSLDLDPGFYWAQIGRAYTDYRRGDFDEAIEGFESATIIDPSAREAMIGQLRCFAAKNDRDALERWLVSVRDVLGGDAEAMRLMVGTLYRTGQIRRGLEESYRLPGIGEEEREQARWMASLILDTGTPMDWLRALEALESIEGERAREFKGRLAWRLGDFESAYDHLAPIPFYRLTPPVRRELRWVRCSLHRYREALEDDLLDGPKNLVIHNRLEARKRSLEAAIDAVEESPSVMTHLRLAQAMKSWGWIRESLSLARSVESEATALSQTWVSQRASRLSEDLSRFMKFHEALERTFVEIYRRHAESDVVPDFDEVLDLVRDLSQDSLGRNVVDPLVVRDYSPIGAFLDPTLDSGSGLVRFFDEYNHFILLGERIGIPPECVTFRRLSLGDLSGEWPDRVELIAVDDMGVKSYLHHRGQNIFGAALFGFTFLDFDTMRQESANILRLADQVGEPWLAPRHALAPEIFRGGPDDDFLDSCELSQSLQEPLDIASRLQLKAGRRFVHRPHELTPAVADSVLAHEIAHLFDARLFWPIGRNLLPNLWRLIKFGFSPARIEAWLEERAQIRGQAKTQFPILALAVTTSYLSSGGLEEGPHAEGYGRVIERFLERLAEQDSTDADLDGDRSLIQQLDLLGDSDITALSQELYQEEF